MATWFTNHMTTNEPTDEILDAVANVLSATPRSPSSLARMAKVTTTEAHAALAWLAYNQMAIAVGHGAWTNYRERRFGEYN